MHSAVVVAQRNHLSNQINPRLSCVSNVTRPSLHLHCRPSLLLTLQFAVCISQFFCWNRVFTLSDSKTLSISLVSIPVPHSSLPLPLCMSLSLSPPLLCLHLHFRTPIIFLFCFQYIVIKKAEYKWDKGSYSTSPVASEANGGTIRQSIFFFIDFIY